MSEAAYHSEEPVGLIHRDTITEIVAHRDAAVRSYDAFFDALESAHKLLREAQSSLDLACGGQIGHAYVDPHLREIEEFKSAVRPPDVEQHKRVARRLVDLQVWGSIVTRTELEVLMDRTAKDELRAQMAYVPERVDRETGQLINREEIEKNIPPVTESSIEATLQSFCERADDIWKRGIAKAFSALDRRFRSHDGFKIGSRVILDRAFDEWGTWNVYSHQRDTLLDIERVFLVLDGRKPTAAYAGIVGIVESSRRRDGGHLSPRQSQHLGTYFEVRVFKNGNAHLWFRRKDLVEKVNKLLADYYGAGLGWGKAEQEDPERPFAGAIERVPAKNFGLFPTPDGLADKVIEAAKLYSDAPLRILEPSAGTGQLARRAARVEYTDYKSNGRKTRLAGHRVTCVEIQPELAVALKEEEIYARVLCRDFLTVTPEPVYDRILMNPPFSAAQSDIDHVYHAWSFLKPGGILVAIMSAGAEFRDTKKAVAFRALMEKNGARWRDLPAGSFAEAGTYVNTILLVVHRGV